MKKAMKIKEILFLTKIAASLRCNIYLVGGAVRDFLLKREVHDFDFAVKGDIWLLCGKFSDKFKYKWFYLDEERGIIRVAGREGKVFDFSLFNNSIVEDISRRDFTVNAVAYDLINDKLIDSFSGVKDIKKGIIRVISEFNIIDDPVRVLRAFRFNTELGFKIEPKSLALIKKHVKLLKKVPKERITDEFFKLLREDKDFNMADRLFKEGIIEQVLNTKTEGESVLKINHGVLKSDMFKKYMSEITASSRTRLDIVKLVLVLLNAGVKKLDFERMRVLLSKKEEEYLNNIWRILKKRSNFVKCLFGEIGDSEKFTNDKEKYHNQLLNISQLKDKNFTIKFYKKYKSVFQDLIFLCSVLDVKVNNEFIKGYFKFLKNEKRADRIINGEMIKELFGLPQGASVGKLLKYYREKIITGEIKGKKELLSLLKE
ncbi:MAG: hypothetical protein ABIH00_02755 [Armatimonadota bacterium]